MLGAGFAGLSAAWHLLKQSPKDSNIRVDIYDEAGIGGGASGVSGGLLHPYSPKAKLLWRAADCWSESLNLLSAAEAAVASAAQNSDRPMPIVRRRFAFFFFFFLNLFILVSIRLKLKSLCSLEHLLYFIISVYLKRALMMWILFRVD